MHGSNFSKFSGFHQLCGFGLLGLGEGGWGSASQDVFVEWNAWTQTETYLLVEKLSSSTQAEEWREVVEQCDSSASFESEAFQVKARRKYACVKGIPFESVTLADVEKSPQELTGWADINVTVRH